MKKIVLTMTILFVTSIGIKAQEQYGKTLNAGLGLGYYGYRYHYNGYRAYATPALNVNYEFDVAKNFTLAPFVSVFGYRSDYYWGNPNYPYRYYRYRETIIPVGVKGTYYFDQLLNASDRWDFYLAASAGYSFHRVSWEDGYYGDRDVYASSSFLYLDGHIGTEFHATQNFGIYLDLSTGMSTLGAAFHF